MDNAFYAMISRMKYIDRWALMRNTEQESLSQHSYEVAVLAHALTCISNERLGTALDENRAAVLGLFHDCAEILTGDMPTPVKYYNQEIRGAYGEVERAANEKLLEMLPEDLRSHYEPVLNGAAPEDPLRTIVKAADKLSALIKCIEEEKAGNQEFKKAKESTLRAIHEMNSQPAELFLKEFLPGYLLTLDQLQ